MDKSSYAFLLESRIGKKLLTASSTELLLVALSCTLLAWYLQFLWKRRELYKHARALPGPFALPVFGSAFSFIGNSCDIFNTITMMFDTYPGIFKVWYGTRLFYGVSDPKYFEIILTNPKAQAKERFYKMAEPVFGYGLFTAPVNIWRTHRKLIMPTFNQKILDQFVAVFVEQSEVLVDVMKKYTGKGEIDLFHIISKCTLDIVCETAMGVKLNAQVKDANFTKWADRAMEVAMMRMFNIFFHIDSIFYRLPIGREFLSRCEHLKSFTRKVVAEKRKAFEEALIKKSTETSYEDSANGLNRKAFLDLLLEITSNDNERLTEDELMDETLTFMVAGSDTTASTNCFLFTMLGLHQEVQGKALEEILEVAGPDRPVDVSDLPKLVYLERVIKETLRLFPVGTIIARALEANIDLGDYVVPKGCSAVFGFRRVHTNEHYWPEPYKFNPDRFLPEEIEKRHPCAFMPFSYGPRNCIGGKYAMMAMKSLMVTVLRKYKIHTSYKTVEEIELKTNIVLKPKDGFKVSIECR